MMWKRLRKLVGADAKAEAKAAHVDATVSLRRAETQVIEAQQITGRINYHGYRNHIGERIDAAWRLSQ